MSDERPEIWENEEHKISIGPERAANVATAIVCASLSAIGSHVPAAEGLADYWEKIFRRLV